MKSSSSLGLTVEFFPFDDPEALARGPENILSDAQPLTRDNS
jgi:hypothetical protein